MKVCLDVLGKDNTPQVADLTIPIGKAIETELRLNFYIATDKDLYENVEKFFHSATGTRQKATVFRLRFKREGIEWETWPRESTHKVGAWALNSFISETGWLVKETIQVGKLKRRTVMRYSQEFLGLKGAILERANELAFCAWPMVCPPNDWTVDERGGYLTEEIRKSSPLVRRKGSLQGCKQGELPIQMLNNLQHVAYRLNLPVLDVANYCFENFITVGKFRRETVLPPPNKPDGEPTKEELKAYKRQRREIEDLNAQLEQKNYRTTEAIYVANKYADEEKFWIAWSFDYRSRIYPLVTSLSPQGTEFDKSLLYFYEEGPINEYWLAFQVATTYGKDKATMEDRIQWVHDNTELISLVATDPVGNLSYWRDVEEPWSFLASCMEYYSCCIAKTKTTSGLPCGIDATQSGIQHLSAMTLDAKAASLVNVLPTAEPADGYRTVAEASHKYIEDKTLHPFIDRKTAKRCTMCLPYGLRNHSARNYIRTALREKEGFDLSVPGRLTEITKAIYSSAIPEVFPGPVEVMKWLQQCAKTIMETQDSIQWTTPSGFVVLQDYRKSLNKRIQTRLMGSSVDCSIGNGWGDPDIKGHVKGLAPNVVHSFDAALIQLTFAEWEPPFTVIHDCVLGRSCDMDQMAKDIRMHFVEMYKRPVLEEWAEEVGVDLPDSIMKRSLDIEQVNDSLYFFC
ncbi:RNA polymerase [Cyanophage SS120-1]|uniref:DNA-directed RNA polymerase n=1 Tax=Cyanophage SS120-1 TaxID=616674 RepID=M1U3A0_9CAUD|nr:RNA polymerase [Cyanophage SS120-1]AGG54508.1 RNA polymerase [Cyanophage SS120-1]